MVSLSDVYAAREVIGSKLVRTPLLHNEALSARLGRPVYLKLENLQKTGSFKPRGVLTKIASMSDEETAHGLITISAGNHAQALAYAARTSEVRCTVVMPSTAPATKVANTRGYGAGGHPAPRSYYPARAHASRTGGARLHIRATF